MGVVQPDVKGVHEELRDEMGLVPGRVGAAPRGRAEDIPPGRPKGLASGMVPANRLGGARETAGESWRTGIPRTSGS